MGRGSFVERLQDHLVQTLAAVPPRRIIPLFKGAMKQILSDCDGKLEGGRVQGNDLASAIRKGKQITVI